MIENYRDASQVINHMRDIINIWSIGQPDDVTDKLLALRKRLEEEGWEEERVSELEQLACFGTRFEGQLPSLSMW